MCVRAYVCMGYTRCRLRPPDRIQDNALQNKIRSENSTELVNTRPTLDYRPIIDEDLG